MCKKLIYLISSVLVLALFLASPVQAADIILVNEALDMDGDGIQDDQLLIDWLVAEGHFVDAQPGFWMTFDRGTTAALNSADLIIISRATNSGNYNNDTEPSSWNAIETPILMLTAYISRSNRWLWINSSGISQLEQSMLEVIAPDHPIFTNVTVKDGMVEALDPTVGSGQTTFITTDGIDMGNGTLIAQVPGGAAAAIAEWDAGVEYYEGAGQIAGGKRMLLCTGTNNTDATDEMPATPQGAWNLTDQGEILLRNAISYMLGEEIEVLEPPAPALIYHWALDDGEGVIATDSVSGLDGSLMGDPQWVDGLIGGALDFDGDGDYVDCGTDEVLNGLSERMTVATWVNIRSRPVAWMAIAVKGENAWRLSVNNETTGLHFGFTGGGRGWQGVNSVTEIPLDEWHHVAGTYDNSVGALIYVDGVAEANNPDLGGTDHNETPFYLGENSESAGRFLDGMLDDVRIYDGALSADEIMDLATIKGPEPTDPGTANLVHSWTFDDGTADDSVGDANGTLVGGAAIVDGALVTTAQDQWMEMPGDVIAINTLEEVTVEAWYTPTAGANASWSMLAYFGDSVDGLGSNGFFITSARGDDKSRAAISVGDIATPWASESGADGPEYDDGMLHHMVSTLDDKEITLYIDGVLIAATPLAEHNSIAGLSNNLAYLAKGGYDGDPEWIGAIHEFNIYNRALTAQEVSYLAGGRATPVNPGTDGLIAYYKLDGDVSDASGNALDGTIMGEPNFVEGMIGMGLQLDGVDDYVDFGNDPIFDLTGSEVTLTDWVNVNDFGNGENDPWIGKGDTSYMLKGHRDGTQIEFFIYDGGWIAAHADVGADANNTWLHAAGTFDNKKLVIYVDGEIGATLDYEGGGILNNEYNVALGSNSQASGRFSEGIHDDVMVYNRALSAGEIRYLAGFRAKVDPGTDGLVAYYPLDGDVLDASGNGLDGTMMGDPNFAEGVAGMALDLDGDGDYVDCGTNEELNSLSQKMTVATWVNIRSITTAWMAIAVKGENAWRLSVNNETTGLHFGFTGGTRGWQGANSVTEIPLDEWHHVAGVYDNEVGGTIYVDGVPETVNADLGGTDFNETPFYLGENSESAGRFLDGMLDEVRVYGRALSEEEILYLASK
jgi:hypothetical protein